MDGSNHQLHIWGDDMFGAMACSPKFKHVSGQLEVKVKGAFGEVLLVVVE